MTRIIRGDRCTRTRSLRASPERTRVLRSCKAEAIQEAEQILGDARRAAAHIVETARSEARHVEGQALSGAEARAAALLAAARAEATRQVEVARSSLTRLAVQIAEKLIGAALDQRPGLVEKIVQQCIDRAGDAGRLTILVNPADLEIIEEALPRLRHAATFVTAAPDAGVPPGGCVLETDLGQLDGRLASQLRMILEALDG